VNLEFKIYELKEDTRNYNRLIKEMKLYNEFIVVGEENIKGYADCYKAIPSSDAGLKLLPLKLDEQAMLIPKDELQLKDDDLPGYETGGFDIPKKYLTLDIVENIQRLNE
jgi:hypothetical protein